MRKAAPFAAALLSAALLWAAFPPCGETAGLAFALAPLLAASRLCAPRRAAAAWFAGGFLFWFGTLSWMPAIVKNNGPWPLVVLGWAGLAALCAGYFALFGGLSAHLWRRAGARPGVRLAAATLGEPILWAGCEWLRATLFTGFAWNFLGTAAASVPALAAPARLGGVYLASALVVLLNGVFATLLCRVAAQMRREPTPGGGRGLRSLETALPLGLIVLALLGGARAGAPGGETDALRVALVQRNAPCIFAARTARENPYEAFGRLLTPTAAARPDLIVFAESAMAEFGRVDGAAARAAARRFLADTGAKGLLAGGDWVDADGKMYNAAALYTPDGKVQIYAKRHLVPFGEYIPFDKWIPPLQKLSPVGVSLWPGAAKTVELDGAPLAPLICYEDTDPALVRDAARLGARAFVLITNDSWFSHSQEAVQHAGQAVLRAVETGLPVIRTGNSGVTGVIAPDGRTRWLTDGAGRPLTDAPGVMVETVALPRAAAATPYVRFGDAPLLALFAAVLAVIAWPRRLFARTL